MSQKITHTITNHLLGSDFHDGVSFQNVIYTIARCLAAILMAQTLYFKFSGATESVYIFTATNMEPWGRYLVGMLELAAVLLIMIRCSNWMGGFLTVGLMIGAIFTHIFVIGLEVMGDNYQLFTYAVIIFICGLFIAIKTIKKTVNRVTHFLNWIKS